MAAKTDRPSVRAETLRAALLKWFSDKNDPSIILSEKVNPAVDPQEDYAVVYEAVFEAASLDQMRVEIWVTGEGHVALFLESRERIARRLGVREGPAGFPVGHEPVAVDEQALFLLLEAVAAGRIAIEARAHVFGLGSVKALAPAVVGQFE